MGVNVSRGAWMFNEAARFWGENGPGSEEKKTNDLGAGLLES
jgi:hypothetical protein